jgi:hypothetical protein
MQKIFRCFLIANRKRRRLALATALWLLRILRNIEYDEMERYEDLIDKLNYDADSFSRSRYIVAEEEWSSCECALGFIDPAIDDLEVLIDFVY